MYRMHMDTILVGHRCNSDDSGALSRSFDHALDESRRHVSVCASSLACNQWLCLVESIQTILVGRHCCPARKEQAARAAEAQQLLQSPARQYVPPGVMMVVLMIMINSEPPIIVVIVKVFGMITRRRPANPAWPLSINHRPRQCLPT